MIDSLLTLTKGRAFWLAIAFLVAVLMHAAVARAHGGPGAHRPARRTAHSRVYFVVSLSYTLVKRMLPPLTRNRSRPSGRDLRVRAGRADASTA